MEDVTFWNLRYYWETAWRKKYHLPYKWSWGKDGKILRDLITYHKIDDKLAKDAEKTICSCIDRFLADPDGFLVGNAHKLSLFSHNYLKYLREELKPKPVVQVYVPPVYEPPKEKTPEEEEREECQKLLGNPEEYVQKWPWLEKSLGKRRPDLWISLGRKLEETCGYEKLRRSYLQVSSSASFPFPPLPR